MLWKRVERESTGADSVLKRFMSSGGIMSSGTKVIERFREGISGWCECGGHLALAVLTVGDRVYAWDPGAARSSGLCG